MIEKILIRVPKKLKDLLINSSKELGISTNAYVLQILWQWAEIQSKIKAT